MPSINLFGKYFSHFGIILRILNINTIPPHPINTPLMDFEITLNKIISERTYTPKTYIIITANARFFTTLTSQ